MSRPTFNRSDTLLGVCEALGQDVGFNPIWLRIALAVGLLWSPVAMIATYLGLGVAVLVARAVTPEPRAQAVAVPMVADNDDEQAAELARAA